jgi:hypothetical protein
VVWTARFRFLAEARDFSLLYSVQTATGFNPVSYKVGTGRSFPAIKRHGSEADHSPPSSAEISNGGTISSFPIRLHDVVFN